MLKIVFIVLSILTELPFVFKFAKAYKECEIIRQTAIILIMLIDALIIFGLYKLTAFVIG